MTSKARDEKETEKEGSREGGCLCKGPGLPSGVAGGQPFLSHG